MLKVSKLFSTQAEHFWIVWNLETVSLYITYFVVDSIDLAFIILI